MKDLSGGGTERLPGHRRSPRRAIALPSPAMAFAACLFALAPWGMAADLSLGGSLETSYSAPWESAFQGSSAAEAADGGSAWFRLTPLLVASGEVARGAFAWEARMAPSLDARSLPASADLGMREARARLWIGDYLSLAVGWSAETAAAAEIFPQTAFLGPSDPLSRFESGTGSARRESEAAIELNASAGAFRASIAYLPFAPELVLPSLDSPWFPSDIVPEKFVINTLIFRLGGISYTSDATETARWVRDSAWKAKAGLSLGAFELDLLAFNGLERQAVLSPYIEVLGGSGGLNTYSLFLRPVRNRVLSFAAASTFVLGSARIWAEGSWTRGASLATGSLDSDFFLDFPVFDREKEPPVSRVSYLPVISCDRAGATLGASWSPEGLPLALRILAEGCWTWFPGAPEGSDRPALSRAAAGSIALGGEGDRMSAAVAGLVSLADGSLVLRPELGLSLGADRKLALSSPFFIGEEGTELGRYRDLALVILSYSESF